MAGLLLRQLGKLKINTTQKSKMLLFIRYNQLKSKFEQCQMEIP